MDGDEQGAEGETKEETHDAYNCVDWRLCERCKEWWIDEYASNAYDLEKGN